MSVTSMSEVAKLAKLFLDLYEKNEKFNSALSMSERNDAMQMLQLAIAQVSVTPAAITYVVPGEEHHQHGQRGQVVGIAVDDNVLCLVAAFPDGSQNAFPLFLLGSKFELTRNVYGKWLTYRHLDERVRIS